MKRSSLCHFSIYPIFILLISLTACSEDADSEGFQSLEEKYPVEILSLESSYYTPVIESFGSLSFTRKTDISPAVEGVVQDIFVEEGDTTDENQLLAVIENIQMAIRKTQAEASLTSASAALELAQTKYAEGKRQVEARILNLEKLDIQIEQKQADIEEIERTIANKEELLEVDGVSQEELHSLNLRRQSLNTELATLKKDYSISEIGLRDEDIQAAGYSVPTDPIPRMEILAEINNRTLAAEVSVAQARVVTARAELQSAELLLSELEIRSSSPGIIGARYKETGERVKPGDPIFTSFQSSELYASFPVQESESYLIYEGMPCEVIVPAMQDLMFEAAIDVISPTIDPQSGNLQVKARFKNDQHDLLPGMFVTVTIQSGTERQHFLIPESALLHTQGEVAEIFIVVSGKAFLKEIQIGKKINGMVEVTGGMEEGELYINEPPPFLKEGIDVQAR